MLFHSSFRKDLARSFGATVVVLLTIVMTVMLIRTLGMASRGGVSPSEISLALGYTMLGYLPIILTMSLFIAIVSTLSRMYADSEMVIWFASGQGLLGFLRPLMRFALPIIAGIAALTLVAWPWSNRATDQLILRFQSRGDLERVAPGQFQESAGGKRVFFIDKEKADDKTANNVFVSSVDNGIESVTSASSGRIEWMDDQRYLVLQNGQRLELNTGQRDQRVLNFERLAIKVGDDVKVQQDVKQPHILDTLDLIKDPTLPHIGELSWRIGMIWSAFNLVFLALAVSVIAPRMNKNGNLIFALLTFLVYNNLVNLGKSWIASGRVDVWTYTLGLHLGVFAIAWLWLLKGHYNASITHSLRRMLRGRGRSDAAEGAT